MDINKDIFRNIIFTEIQENLEIYKNMSYHVSNIKKDKILRDEIFICTLEKINDIFKNINDEAIKLDDIEIISSELFKEYSIKQQCFKEELVELIKNIGYGSVKYLVKMLIPEDEYDIVKDDLLNIEFIDKYFCITNASLSINDDDGVLLSVNFNKIKEPIITQSLVYKINNCQLVIKTPSYIISMNGYFMLEQLNSMMRELYFLPKYNLLLKKTKTLNVPHDFALKYIEQLPDSVFSVNSCDELLDIIENDYNYLQKLSSMLVNDVYRLFENKKDIDRQKILVLLLLSEEKHNIIANVIFGNCLSFDDTVRIKETLHWSLQKKLKTSDTLIRSEFKKINNGKNTTISFHEQLLISNASNASKERAMMKIKEMQGSKDCAAKAESYLTTFFKIPFGIYKKEEIFLSTLKLKEKIIFQTNTTKKIHPEIKDKLEHYEKIMKIDNNDMESYVSDILKIIDTCKSPSRSLVESFNEISSEIILNDINKRKFMKTSSDILDNCVYGHENVKLQLKMLFGQWMNGGISGSVIGLQGNAGIGKTELIRNGLSKCIIDHEGNERPFIIIGLAGAKDSCIYEGHSYTYTGAQHGKFLNALIDSKCMNPIILFDEVDKISETAHGSDVYKLLIHLTDPIQNDKITDKFFQGVDLDFSKCLFVFTYNNINNIDPILRNRITNINVKSLQINEKIEIVKLFSIPKISKNIGINTESIIFDDDAISHLIRTYTNEAGMRKLNEKITEILRHVNYSKIMCKHPIKSSQLSITIELIDDILHDHMKARHKKISGIPQIGTVNGLYACESGTGGITFIQIKQYPSEDKMGLELTGNQGNTMKESMKVGKTLAWDLMTNDEKTEYSKNKTILHIHCPDGATPKDGPSAGAAITLAIYSAMTNRKIDNTIAMTGEIDLFGNVGAIGGLEAKINGAINAGCSTVLIPTENEPEYNKLPLCIKESSNLDIIMVSTILQVLNYSLI